MSVSIIILTFNSAASIRRTLAPLSAISHDIHILDSGSTDNTLIIANKFGCKIVTRRFDNYADQRNWAIQNLPLSGDWELHLDADEELSLGLLDEIRRVTERVSKIDYYLIRREIVFMGKQLRFSTWHCRLFRRSLGVCEDRLYDQHFVCSGMQGHLMSAMIDHQDMSITEWTVRHLKWAGMESDEMTTVRQREIRGEIILPSAIGGPIQRKRYLKGLYYSSPLFLRAFCYFFYRYFIKAGFLDGTPGLIYHVLQGFWFRFLVDAKIYENLRDQRRQYANL